MAEGNNLFQLEIITPDRIFYQGEAYMVEFTAEDGDIGVYKNHIPLTTVIAPGILNIKEAQGEKKAALHSGFVQILPEKVTILAEVIEWPDEIDENRAEEARKHSHTADIETTRAEIALQKALVRLNFRKTGM